MSYYRRLPIDVRVAIWADEHRTFLRFITVVLCATSATGMLSLIARAIL